MDTDTTAPTASDHDAAFIYREWDARTRAHDIDACWTSTHPTRSSRHRWSRASSTAPAGSSPAETRSGHSSSAAPTTAPTNSSAGTAPGATHFDGQTLMWEYPRAHPDGGDQVDLAEVMDLRGPQIAHHRIYWGWFGTPLLIGVAVVLAEDRADMGGSLGRGGSSGRSFSRWSGERRSRHGLGRRPRGRTAASRAQRSPGRCWLGSGCVPCVCRRG